MSDLTLIVLSAGNSTRFNSGVKKQWLRINDEPLWSYVTNQLNSFGYFSKIIITSHKDEVEYMKLYSDFTIVEGSSTRQGSLLNALNFVETKYVMVTDVARACISKELIQRLIDNKDKADVIVPTINISDTLVHKNTTVDRDQFKRVQTPQLSLTSSIIATLKNSSKEFTDESSAMLDAGYKRFFVDGDELAQKITYPSDLNLLRCLKKPSNVTLCGNGFDVHQFEKNKKMYLCGIEIDSDFGFKAHSDGDVAIHALIDSILGAASLGDIGTLFPDTDNAYEGIDSMILLERAFNMITSYGYKIINCDITIIAQTPKLMRYKDAMRTNIALALGLKKHRVNVKATTTEKLGFVGRKEGVAVMANTNLTYIDWTKL